MGPEWFANVYRAAGVSSIAMCIGLQVHTFTKGYRQQSLLLRQVAFLCLSDSLVHLWELSVCRSWARVKNYCVSFGGCGFLYPLLRTLQVSSILWTAQLTLALMMGVRHSIYVDNIARFMHMVWPVAISLNIPQWAAGATGAFVESRHCDTTWAVSPDAIFAAEFCLILAGIFACHGQTFWRLHQRSTAAALTRHSLRASRYVGVLCVSYFPWVICQAVPSTQRMKEVAYNPYWQVMFFGYMLTGMLNTLAYGYYYWQPKCCRRAARVGWRTTSPTSFRNEARVVMFTRSAILHEHVIMIESRESEALSGSSVPAQDCTASVA